jgi:hypothetical protein
VKLDLETLDVQSFATVSSPKIGIGYCCTGCVSGCGINPTASGCESGGGNTYEYLNCGNETIKMDAAAF